MKKTLLRVKYLQAKLSFLRFNYSLPRFLRITKFGIFTTIISFILSISIVSAADKTGERVNLDRFTENQLGYTLSNLANGLGPGTYNSETGETSAGALTYMNSFVSEVYYSTSEISATKEVEATVNKLGFGSPVNAQAATGITQLRPINVLWGTIRNISLGFIVLVGIILAFFILLGVRQGQGFVTVFNAFPKIIVSIILIIMSYSLGGLMLDVSTLGTRFVLNIFYSDGISEKTKIGSLDRYPCSLVDDSGKIIKPVPTQCEGQDFNVFRLMSTLVAYQTWGTERDCSAGETPNIDSNGDGTDDKCGTEITDIIATPTNIKFLDPATEILNTAGIGLSTIKLIIEVFILMTIVKVFFGLLSAFVQVVLRVITAPIEFLTIPLRGYSALSSWIKFQLSNVLVFPGTMLMFLLAALFAAYGTPEAPFFMIDQFDGKTFSGIHPLITHSVNTGGNSANFIGRVIAVVIVSQIPNLQKYIQQAFQVATPDIAGEVGQKFKAAATKIPVVGGIVNWMS